MPISRCSKKHSNIKVRDLLKLEETSSLLRDNNMYLPNTILNFPGWEWLKIISNKALKSSRMNWLYARDLCPVCDRMWVVHRNTEVQRRWKQHKALGMCFWNRGQRWSCSVLWLYCTRIGSESDISRLLNGPLGPESPNASHRSYQSVPRSDP